MKKGFILIEVLLSLIISGFMMILISGISNVLMNFPEITYVSQLDMFSLQMDQLLSISKNHEIKNNALCFDLDLRHFCLEFEDKRLVKKPGYEIVLGNLNDVRWELNQYEIVLYGIYDKESFTVRFKIN